MNKFYKAKIEKVLPGSIAENYNIESGDSLLSIDDSVIRDLIDYQFAVCDTEKINFLVEKPSGETKNIVIVKKNNDDVGIIFESAVFDKLKLCNNHCIFCFVDQQPEGLRETLYIKDDDYRLSYLQGTYITLTNLTNQDKKRIEQLRIGPLFISVHTTIPEVRKLMLGNKLAGDILDKLNWLNDLYIPVHTQIVVCPGFNDGESLDKTLYDLSKLENVLSVAIVPVGITKYRTGDFLKPLNKQLSRQTIDIANKYNNILSKKFAFPADEIYFMAERPLPEYGFYNNFPQLEDGVGSIRCNLENFSTLKLPQKINNKRHIGIITSELAALGLQPIFDKLKSINNLKVDIIQVQNSFLGESVTVAGLICGQDIINTLNSFENMPKEMFLPSVMLKKYANEFIDSIKVEQIEDKFSIKIHIIYNYYSFEELINVLAEY